MIEPKFAWNVCYWIERRWFRWRVCASYGLLFPPDGGMSHSIGYRLPDRYWHRHYAEAHLRILEFHAKYGQPSLHRTPWAVAESDPNS